MNFRIWVSLRPAVDISSDSRGIIVGGAKVQLPIAKLFTQIGQPRIYPRSVQQPDLIEKVKPESKARDNEF